MSLYARVVGTGGYLPEKILTNAALEKQIDTSDEWILTRTGIAQRHIAAEDESVVSMAHQAAQMALENAGLSCDKVGLVLVATSTPERSFPSTACLVQRHLDITCPAFDVNAACAGFSYALHLANQFITSGQVEYALVIGSETMSRLLDWQDRTTCILFGDGAGAVLLAADKTPGILASQINAQGEYTDLLYTQNKDNAMMIDSGTIKMQGSEVFKVAVKTLSQLVDDTLAQAGLTRDHLNWLVPHQANLRIIQATAKQLGLPLEQVILTIAEQGNTSAASIPLALHRGICDRKIQPGDHLLLESFGAGFTWGGAVIRY